MIYVHVGLIGVRVQQVFCNSKNLTGTCQGYGILRDVIVCVALHILAAADGRPWLTKFWLLFIK